MATECYGEMSSCLFNFNWQDLPLDLHKYSILLIVNAQRPMLYHGFGISTLSLETFNKVSGHFKSNNKAYFSKRIYLRCLFDSIPGDSYGFHFLYDV